MEELRFRQVHLDFHTSEAIPGIGKDWDKKHFQDMLKLGHVNSINVFAKCHHGWCYYPTKVQDSEMHPNLKVDLLGEMIEAAHEIDVKIPAYISAGLDEKLAVRHSDWLFRRTDGTTSWAGWTDAGYHEFCMRSPYLDYLIAQAEEVAANYNSDGIWLDIVGVRDCACGYCVSEMRARGWDPRDADARQRLGRETYLNYARRINAAINAIKPGTLIYHNSGHVTGGDRELAALPTHQELESLPTGGWGYDHFPLSARYVHATGIDFLGMTGKFHTSWGEFGGFKHPNALRFEAGLALTNGAKICVGDQMHPFGKLDQATYRLIGEAFVEVEAKEVWCKGVKSISDVGVLSIQAFAAELGETANKWQSDAGVVRVLQEGKVSFDILDRESDLSNYKVVVLPDVIPVAGDFATKLKSYLANGGKVFATGRSALDAPTGEFALDFGVKYLGESGFDPEYIVPKFDLSEWDNTGFVVYSKMNVIEVTTGEVMAERQDPFFNRDYLHFCSHQHAPSTMENAGAAMVKTPNTVYLAVNAFDRYADLGQNVLREIILRGIRELLTEPTLVTSLPAQGVQSVMRQEKEARTIVHLLYGAPVLRGKINVLEDLTPVYDVKVELRASAAPKRVYLAPQNVDLDYTFENGVIKTTVPVVECHQMVVVE